MTSHELARLLLARRDNDLVVQTEIDNDPGETGDEDLYDWTCVKATGLEYDSEHDRLVLMTETHFSKDWE